MTKKFYLAAILLMIFMHGKDIKSQSFEFIDTCFYSAILDEEKCIRVYLPPGYTEDSTYPVVYYLHGAGGDYEELIEFMPWIEEMITDEDINPMIFVGLDGRAHLYGGSMFTNSVLNGDYEDYIIQEVIPFAESSFSTKNSMHYRCITGASMGGYGSMKLQLKHPDIFTGVASFIGPLQVDTTMVLWQPELIAENTGPPYNFTYPTGMFTSLCFTVAAAFSPNLNILPYQVEFPYDTNCGLVDSVIQKWKEHDCSHLASNLDTIDYENPGIFFACGTNDNLHFYEGNTCFEDTLQDLGIAYKFYTDNNGHMVDEEMFRAGILFLDSVMFDSIYVGSPENYLQADPEVLTFPNPVSGHLSIQLYLPYRTDINLTIHNMQGQEVRKLRKQEQNMGSHKFRMDIPDLVPGIYLLRVQSNYGMITKKIIKR